MHVDPSRVMAVTFAVVASSLFVYSVAGINGMGTRKNVEYNEDPDFGMDTVPHGTRADRRHAMRPSDPDVLAVLTIDEDDINGELADVAANLAYWAFLLNRARADLRRAKAEREALRGELDSVYRPELSDETGKKPTNAQVDAAITADSDFLEAQGAVADAEHRVNNYTVVCEGIRVKADCLRSLSANRRAEMEALRSAP